jgi:hypothetical protein
MTTIYCKLLLLTGFLSIAANEEIPKGWVKAGSMPTKYETGIVKDKTTGNNTAFLKSAADEVKGFGTLMQQFKADAYKGQRVRMTGLMRCENVIERTGFWLRVDDEGATTPLAFDNMGSRPLKGTTGWAEYNIVLDVPHNADAIAFGVLLMGTGQVWIDDMRFEVVNKTIAVTEQPTVKKILTLPTQPVNLSFD